MGDRRTFRASIHRRRTELEGGDARSVPWVHCPLKAGSVELAQCRHCDRLLAEEAGALVCCDAPRPIAAVIGEVLSPLVVCVDGDLTLEELRALFARDGLDSAPVVEDEGVLLGVVGRDDLARAAVPEHFGAFQLELTAEELMHPEPSPLLESASIQEAIERLGEARVDRLTVVTREHVVVGTLSRAELLKYLAAHAW
jgi:CBS domain-containing protein